ncbi:anti-sigma factor [Actinomadura sp. ATCC 31491]|uniref:Regulator of SigK n=1 Tax=Actinomadura luzonensis TaxID=2805427 RepID=A0ABT0G2V4_9ACTN|nr:anti-sigma factor [Actinomadura luzonensis]MCK2218949.1 anti-sigma factor [Actinomadura luzonensis]
MNDDLHALSGPYAVHALPYGEWVLFEEHLRGCGTCGTEVRRLRETAARLAEAVAAPPPPPLRTRLLTAAYRRRPWPPGLHATPGTPSRPAPRPVPGPDTSPDASPDASPDTGQGEARAEAREPGDADAATVVELPRTAVMARAPQGAAAPRVEGTAGAAGAVRARGRAYRAVAGLAAACAAVAVGLGALALDARRDAAGLAAVNHRLSDANDRLIAANDRLSAVNERLTGVNDRLGAAGRQVVAVLSAPDARTVRHPATSGGTATLVLSRSAARLLFTTSGLPELPASKGYELWLTGRDGPRPAGLLGRAEEGVTAPVVVTPRPGEARVALTVEPARGSRRPTTAPVLLADLPGA